MAEVIKHPSSGADASAASESVAVKGWASSEWHQEAAVIVNPEAQPIELVSWAAGQIEQTLVLASIIGTGATHPLDIDPAEVAGALRHPLEQALTVLRAAADKMFAGHSAQLQAERDAHG
jgi:hypothetical protein